MKRGHNLPIAQSVNQQLLAIAKKMGGGAIKVGFLEDKTYPDGTPVAAVAYWNEFGHEGQFPSPPRSFFRVMISKQSSGWPGLMSHLAQLYNYDGARVLAAMGKLIEEQLQESIRTTEVAPLSETTLILRKRFGPTRAGEITIKDVLAAQAAAARGEEGATGTEAKPLIWTHTMLDSVGSEVVR